MRRRVPVATLTLLAVTGLFTGLQFVFPAILTALRRNPDALHAGEWWRMITPLFVHAEGWPQILFNFTAIAIVGAIVERIYGSRLWLFFYFAGGLTGEIAGYAWKPHGAGASVGGAGLLGALTAWLLSRKVPLQPRIGGGILLAGALALTVFRDLHGPPILLGVGLAALVLQQKTETSAKEAGKA
jgi:rhomboid protease GluP